MKVRIGGFAHLAAEADPIVAALHSYESRMGRPPNTLAELVPSDLPKLPWWSGRLQYYRSDDGSTMDLYGNPWALRVNAGFGMGFDSFVYFPTQNYPTYFYGGGPERVGTWAYVHE